MTSDEPETLPRVDSGALASTSMTGRVEPAEDWEPGDVVAHRYELQRKLGGGSTGDVWLAEDRLLRKQVALKMLQRTLAHNRDTVHRFLREVALAHSVTHRNVVRIYDTGEADGQPFFTMEYLQGKTLEELLGGDVEGRPGERLPFEEAREIAFEVLDGMEAAHRVGVVHRDLKPGNVMLTHRGAIVMDFGVAGIEEVSEPPNAAQVRSLVRTEAGTIFGSPAYMAPELWEGAPATVQSDLYAFGVMLYQMLAGRLPYDAQFPAAYLQQLNAGPPPPLRSLRRDTPWSMVRLVRRCMAVRPADRPMSAAAAANLIAPLRNKARRTLLATTTIVLVAIGIASFVRIDPRHRDLGLPDAAAEAELLAATRMHDVGDSEAAVRSLDRLARTVPTSAALAFWRATMLASLGDDAGRRARCEHVDEAIGGERWRALALAACEPRYRLAAADRILADPELGDPNEIAWLPLAVETQLLPELERSLAPEDPTRARARAVLARLERAPVGPLALRWQLARVDLELALGRGVEASQHLAVLEQRHPDAPIVQARAAWLALHEGHLERAQALAQAIRVIDPTPAVRLLLHRGHLDEAWQAIEVLTASPRRSSLVEMWCGYAWRFAVGTRPPQCRTLPPGLAAALWASADQTAGRTDSPLEDAIAQAEREHSLGGCTVDPNVPVQLSHASPPFELRLAELAVLAALCSSHLEYADLERAHNLVVRLVATAPADPWVSLLRARVDEARGELTQARTHRLRAAELWRSADDHLPLVWQVRGMVEDPSPARRAEAAG